MGKDSVFGRLADAAGEALGKVDTPKASKAVNRALDAAQKVAGPLGRKADPLVKKAKQAAPGLIDRAKSAVEKNPPKPAAEPKPPAKKPPAKKPRAPKKQP